jgi:hypothetical protein
VSTATPGAAAATARTAKTAAAPIHFRASLVDIELPPPHVGPVQSGDGLFGLVLVRHFDERESARTACIPVSHDTYGLHCPVDFENGAHLFFTGTESQVAYENLFHVISSEI